ncbi:MAG TPA: DUF4153 domain-containing protein, partial [bacterium]
IKIFARWYYRAQVPLVIMLLLAIWRRISEYGVTENRYFVLVMGASLAAIVLYFIFSKQKNIKIIPLTLCSLAFLSAFGPWSAFAVSARSQMHRLETLLLKNNILIEGFVQKSSQPPRFADTKEISSIVQYLCDTHGPEILQPWFKQDLQQALQDSGETEVKIYGNRTATRMVGLMGLAFVSQWETAVGRHFSFNSKREGVYALVGYDYLLQSNELNYSSNTETFSAGASTYTLVFDHERSLLTLKGNGEEELLLSIELTPLVRRLLAEYATSQFSGFPPSEKMTIAASNQLLKTKFCFLSLQGQREGGALKIFSLKVDVFIGKLSTILQIEQ